MGASLLHSVKPGSIAVFRALQLGDMLCAVPALRALRKACPEARITLVGLPWAQAFAERYPHYVDDFIAFPGVQSLPEQTPDPAAFAAFVSRMQQRRFDLALQMHGNGSVSNRLVALFGAARTAGFGSSADDSDPPCFLPYPERGSEIRRLTALSAFLGAPPCGEEIDFSFTRADEAELAASGLTAGLARGAYLCLHPGARAANRRWPPERFAAVGDALHAASGLPLVLTGSAAETQLTRAVQHAMRTPAVDAAAPISAGALALLLRDARLLVCNDTGVAHLAAALKLPCVIVYRASEVARWAPLDGQRHRAVWVPAENGPPDEGFSAVLKEALALLAEPLPAATAPGSA